MKRGLTYNKAKAVFEKELEIRDCEGEIGLLERCLALDSVIGRQRASYTEQLQYYQNRLNQLKTDLLILKNPQFKGKAT